VLGVKRQCREDGRPARKAWFYVMVLVHGPNKSSEWLSEYLFPALEAPISKCSSTLTHITLYILLHLLYLL
jgi:hypothetical protein